MRMDTRDKLKTITTATITMQLLKRGVHNVYMRGVRPLNPISTAERMVGEAYTVRYIPMREDLFDLSKLASPENLARRAIEECPAGAIMVIDARGEADCGTYGDILATRLKHRGVAGVVTDGGVRDAAAVGAIGLPAFAAGPAAPASPTMHIPVGLEEPVACGGVTVYPGDVLVGDGDGVVVIPQALADDVARDGADQDGIEDFIQKLVASGRPVIGTYPPNDKIRQEFEDWIVAGKPEI
jgi:regulator of RNase E activity RraA